MEDTVRLYNDKGLGEIKFSVKEGEERRLKSWEHHAKSQILIWLVDNQFKHLITTNNMKGEMMGEFTKFLYWFACRCECGWGVMIDFNDRKQRVFLTDLYYKWMHKLRDEIQGLETDP